ncbi:MAG: hypothetical protein ACRC9U_00880, partial [Metamycoplasmataceae bacterium]
ADVKDLIITAKTTSKLTKDDIAALKGANNSAQLAALNKLFGGSGLTSANQDKFIISVDESKKIVTLTAKSGYTINGQNTLASKPYTDDVTPPTDTDLKITAQTTAATLTETEVTNLTSTNNKDKLAALQKLFTGADLKIDNFGNFDVSVNRETRKATLTAKTNFTINGNKILDSLPFTIALPEDPNLTITAKTEKVELTTIDLLDLSGNEVPKQKIVINKLFNGITDSNFNNFTFAVASSGNNVVLTAKPGFNFSGNQTLSKNYSPINSAINITVKSGTPRLTKIEIAKLKEPPIPANAADQLSLLSRVFNGIDSTNQNFFTIEVDEIFTTIALNTKPGFVIGTDPNSKLTQIVSIFQYNRI